MHILFVSGGSVGHLAPAVAVWRAVRSLAPDAQAHVLCAERADEREFLRAEGMDAVPMPLPRRGLLFPLLFLRALLRSFALLKTLRPDVVMSKGGALSVPLCIAARLRGIPIVLHESDAVMGLANRIVSLMATTVCLGFDGASGHRRAVVTGNPIRPMVTQGSKEEGMKLTGLTGDRPVLLVTGGSQGAAVLNAWVQENIHGLLEHCDVVHITGRNKAGAGHRPGYWQREFVTDELPHLYAMASLAVCRAGAGSIFELAATGVPAVLVPIPELANNHQVKNAEVVERSGGCVVTPQAEVQRHLFGVVTSLLADRAKRDEMSARMASVRRPDAALQIAREVLACVARTSADA